MPALLLCRPLPAAHSLHYATLRPRPGGCRAGQAATVNHRYGSTFVHAFVTAILRSHIAANHYAFNSRSRRHFNHSTGIQSSIYLRDHQADPFYSTLLDHLPLTSAAAALQPLLLVARIGFTVVLLFAAD